jgi:hypothetical protein
MLGKIICSLPRWLGGGHRRGRRVADVLGTLQGQGLFYLQCPRCGATWTRKIKVKETT